ncbi:MAG: SDR family oxidoreductase [Deltaproteobacteria bacterium]|nr:SDR family oxidoreductase [Deltaproteobacteria bacterium]
MTETVFITGATSGFGEACAQRFAKEGWKLVLAARRTERLLALQKQLGGKSSVCVTTLDVRDPDAVRTALEGLPDAFQSIDVLVNNAGLALGMGPAHQAATEDWDTMVDTNIKGVLHCTHAILPRMVERNKGHIVNIGSVAGDYAYPGGNVYGSTKAFVKQFSRNLRADLIGTALRVTNIEPGLAETEFNLVRFKGDKEKATQLYKGTDSLTAEDIAETVYWAVSRPPHVNINRIEVMPVCQSWAMFAIDRK